MSPEKLSAALAEAFGDLIEDSKLEYNEVTIQVSPKNLIEFWKLFSVSYQD